jgi:hypothetical protein
MASIDSAIKALETVAVSKTKELKGVSYPPALLLQTYLINLPPRPKNEILS